MLESHSRGSYSDLPYSLCDFRQESVTCRVEIIKVLPGRIVKRIKSGDTYEAIKTVYGKN